MCLSDEAKEAAEGGDGEKQSCDAARFSLCAVILNGGAAGGSNSVPTATRMRQAGSIALAWLIRDFIGLSLLMIDSIGIQSYRHYSTKRHVQPVTRNMRR